MIRDPRPESASILPSDAGTSMARCTRRHGRHAQLPCHVALMLAGIATLCFGGSSFHSDAEAFQLRHGRDLLAVQDPASANSPVPPSPPSNSAQPPPPTNETTPAGNGSMSTRASVAVGPAINQADWSVLRFLKFSVGGGVYVFPELVSWRATAPCNDFYGITCNANGRVVSIELDNLGLNGTILPLPLNSGYPNLGTMGFLRYASFKNNVLSGGIPTAFQSNLTYLDLSSNKFNISLPNNFTAPGLQLLNLSNNAFTVASQGFNGFLSRLLSLRSLSISRNRLTGGLPTAVGALSLLSSMDLSYNALSGQIITQLGNLKSLRYLDLTSNDLAGSIPPALSSCTGLNQLLAGQNMLSALPPPALSEIKQLRVLNMSFNAIAAQLPTYITTYSALQTLDMQSNALTGVVLDGFSSVKSLGHLNLKHNKLAGMLPSSLGRLSALSYLNLGYNSITGVIPSSFATLLKNALYVYLDHNKLYGQMPSGTTSVPAFFDVSFNQLTGKLPPGASNGPYGAPWLYNVAYNYFVASSQVVVSGQGVQFCPNQNYGYSPFVGYFGSLAKNCISSSSSGRCLPEAQRRPAACAAFCGTTSAAGACGGNGYCYLQGPNLLPTCLCFPGYQPGETRDSCVRAGSAALAASAAGAEMIALSDSADGSSAAPEPAPGATDVGPVDVDASDTSPTVTAAAPPGGYTTGYKLQPTTTSRQFLAPFFRYAALGASARRLPSWSVPSNWNWQRFFASGPGNQGSCASSWAFATTQALSILWNQTYRAPSQDLSVQQVIACQGSVCNGANAIDALEYVGRITTSIGRTGLTTSAVYPYKGQAQPACQTSLANRGTQGLTQYEAVQFDGWLGLVLALQKLPVIVALQASASTFQSYMGGFVYVDAGCYTGVPNHAVAVVGYSLTAATPYFVLRNSWGTGWGEGGYMRIGIAPGDGVCGMLAGPGYIPLVPGANVCGAASAPCGSGECVPRNSSAAPYTINTCKTCPPGFASVITFTGIQECAPINICKMQAFNPCGVGTCLSFTPNKYTCQCPPGYNFVTLAATNTATCVPNVNAPAGTYCQAFYSVSGDQEMCSFIAQRFNITLNNIFEWNRGIACFYPLTPGLSVCVKRATFKPAVRACTSYYGVEDQDTCTSVVKLQRPPLRTLDLYRLNPGVMCQTLTPNITSGALSQGTKVCVADVAAPVACGSGGTYRVVAGDTCPIVLSKAFGGSPANLAAANNGLVCDDRRLFVGQLLCRP